MTKVTIYLLWHDPVDPDCGWARTLVLICTSRSAAEQNRERLLRDQPEKYRYDDSLYIEEMSAYA